MTVKTKLKAEVVANQRPSVRHPLMYLPSVLLICLGVAGSAGGQQQMAAHGYEVAFIGRCPGRSDSGPTLVAVESGICRVDAGGSNARLIHGGSVDLLQPGWWSPDGRKLVYLVGDQANPGAGLSVRAVNIDGTEDEELPVSLYGMEIQMAWSSDSTRIAFASAFDPSDFKDPEVLRGRKLYSTAIYALDTRTRKVSRLTPPGLNHWPSWSPDGSRIAFSGTEPGEVKPNIYVVGFDGAKPRLIFAGPTINVLPAWSPKGDQIAFVAAAIPGPQQRPNGIFVMRDDGSMARRIGDTWNMAAWSPDGRFILTNSTIITVATGATVDLGPEQMIDAAFSPDGRSLIYRFDRNSGTINAIDINGKNRRKLADGTGGFFAVSPLLIH